MKALTTVGGAVVGGIPGALLARSLFKKKKATDPAPAAAPPVKTLDPNFGALAPVGTGS